MSLFLEVAPCAWSTTFTVAGEPKGQPRPRAFAMRMGGGKFSARVFDSGTAEGWKSCVASAAACHAPSSPVSGPVSVSLQFAFRRPKSHYRTGARASELRENAPRLHTGKPDADNLAKAVMDALTQLGTFWMDDSQVAQLFVSKSYGPTPGVAVSMHEIRL